MPPVSIPTVTASSVAPDNVAVNVKDVPAFSAIDEALTVKVTVGADSFSVIVTETDCDPLSVAPPPETPSIVTVTVSSSSYILSSVGSTTAVPVVAPALIVISEIFA